MKEFKVIQGVDYIEIKLDKASKEGFLLNHHTMCANGSDVYSIIIMSRELKETK